MTTLRQTGKAAIGAEGRRKAFGNASGCLSQEGALTITHFSVRLRCPVASLRALRRTPSQLCRVCTLSPAITAGETEARSSGEHRPRRARG